MEDEIKKAMEVYYEKNKDKYEEFWDEVSKVDESQCVELFTDKKRNEERKEEMHRYITAWCNYNFPKDKDGTEEDGASHRTIHTKE